MRAIFEFGMDVWKLSAPRIRRADPLLMGAAIAYNSLFALFPLALAFVALLTFFDATSDVIQGIYDLIERNLSAEASQFIIELMQDSLEALEAQRFTIVVISMLLALWSGSRAVYAIQKALRTVQGRIDERGYLRARLLGVAVTAAATVGVLVGYSAIVLGSVVFQWLADVMGLDVSVYQTATGVAAVLLAFALLWAIYIWGPPEPMRAPAISSAIATTLVAIGLSVVPAFGTGVSTAVGAFSTMALFLVFLYFAGVVIVATPTVIDALLDVGEDRWRRYRGEDESRDVTTG